MQNKNIPHIQKHSSTILSRTVFPAHVLALSVMVGWSAQPSSEFPASSPSSELLSLESDGGAGMFSCLARLCSIMHTRIVLHAFGGWMRKPCHRHLHLCLMTPMHCSTVVRVELCAKLYRICFGVVTWGRGVISHVRSIYPLSPTDPGQCHDEVAEVPQMLQTRVTVWGSWHHAYIQATLQSHCHWSQSNQHRTSPKTENGRSPERISNFIQN